MARRDVDRPWSDYRLGMVVTAAVGLLGVSIFVIGSTAGPFRPGIRSYTIDVDDAAGLRVGSVVRVGGVTAGEVSDITIIPPREEPGPPPLGPGDTLPLPERLESDVRDVRITLSIQEPYFDNVTASSRAQLAILGVGAERYVKITAGDVRERPLDPGSTIPTVPSVDWDLVLGRLARAFNEMEEIGGLTDEIKTKLVAEKGTVGQLLDTRAELYGQVRALQAETRSLLDLMDHGPGFVALYRNDGELRARVDSLSANLEAIRVAMDDPRGVLRSWTDPTDLRDAIAGLRGELAELDARLGSGRGSLGRFLNDQELWVQVRLLNQEIADLMAAFKANPLRFINIRIF